MTKLSLVPLLVTAVACRSPIARPLSHTVDTTRIATVPLESKQAVTEAQQAYDVAQLLHTTADTEFRDSSVEIDLAEYQAKHGFVVSIVGNRTAAETTRPGTSEASGLARQAANAKITFMVARHNWLAKVADAALIGMYAAQARLELERAKVAQSNNAAPAGFDVQVFQRQADERASAAQTANDAVVAELKLASDRLTTWKSVEVSALEASGLKGPVESDRFAAELERITKRQAAAPAAHPAPARLPPAPAEPTPAPALPAAPPAQPQPPKT